MPVKRTLYKSPDHTARYEIAKSDDKEVYLRVYDVVGGDALVFLTPARARRLIADLEPHAGRTVRR